MNEARVTAELHNVLARLWCWPIKGRDVIKCRGCGALLYPEGGRPDIIVQDAAAVIEVKMFSNPGKAPEDWPKATFNFKEITVEQRTWLTMWAEDSHSAFLALGTPHGTAGAKKQPRMLWVMPWEDWLDTEAIVRDCGRKSLPLYACPGQRPKDMAEHRINAMTMLSEYALEWGSGRWHVPPGHALEYIAPMSYHFGGERDLEAWSERWGQVKEETKCTLT